MPHPKAIAIVIVSATLLSLASTSVRRSVQIGYPDIADCELSCRVAAIGFPFPFVADYPGISPVGSVSLTDAMLGIDRLLIGPLTASFLFWTALVAVIVWFRSRIFKSHRASRKDKVR
jgi:hypothetical protein